MEKVLFEKFAEAMSGLSDTDKARMFESLSLKLNVKRPKLPPNVMVFQTAAFVCASKMSGSANKILMLFIALSAYENVIGMDVKTIAEDCGMSERSVIRGLKELVDAKVITKVDMIGDRRRNEYFLSPFGVWKGNSVQRNKIIARLLGHDPDQIALFGIPAQEHVMRESLEIRDKKGLDKKEKMEKIASLLDSAYSDEEDNDDDLSDILT